MLKIFKSVNFSLKQARMYYRSVTGGHCCIGAGRRWVFTHQVAALCCVNLEIMAWNRKSNSINRWAFTWRKCCQISSRSDL